MKNRKSGVLLPISALPGKYGIGTFSKKDMSLYGMVGMGLLSGFLLIGIFVPIFIFFIPGAVWWYNLVVSVILVVALLCSALADTSRIKQIASSGMISGNSNLALLCALNIYTDIIAILFRILYILFLISGGRK